MININLGQPFPKNANPWKNAIFVSVFIILFLLIFQPFGLSQFDGSNKILIITGYGIITLVAILINSFIVPLCFKNWFHEKSWTVFKQIIIVSCILFTIGLGNFLYTCLFFNIFWSVYGFLLFQFYTLIIGVIPVVVITIIVQNKWLIQNLKSANDLNKDIADIKTKIDNKQIICLIGDNQKYKIEMELSQLLYIESTGNYIKIVYHKDNNAQNFILRCALKRAEMQLDEFKQIIKCHRAFIVNISNIIHIKGNAQGLQLLLKNTEAEIPVSRNLVKKLKDHIQVFDKHEK